MIYEFMGANPLFFDSVIGKLQCMHPTHTLSIMSMKEQYKGFKWESTYSVCFMKRSLNKQRCPVWHTNQWRKTFVMVGNYTEVQTELTATVIFFSFLPPWREVREKTGEARRNWIWEKGKMCLFLSMSSLTNLKSARQCAQSTAER